MISRIIQFFLLAGMSWLLLACGSVQPTSDSTLVTVTPAGSTTDTEAAQEGEDIQIDADRDAVSIFRRGEESPKRLPAPERDFLNVNDGVNVDERGRAILRFADLLTVEVMRQGRLEVRELPPDQQTPFLSVLETGGAFLNDFDAGEAINRRFTIETEFATITATGTRFLVAREPDNSLEWVIGLEAAPNTLEVTADGITKMVQTNIGRWIAPFGEPSAGISYDQQAVNNWLQNAQAGITQQEIGEVLWPQANSVVDTTSMPSAVQIGQTYTLGDVQMTLDSAGTPTYSKQDCNGDGIDDLVVQNGRLELDFRQVLARVRALDVTVINLDQPNSGSLTALDPGRQIIDTTSLTLGPGQGVILSLFSPTKPFHYAELALSNGCFLGLSLTPPGTTGDPPPPRPAVTNWQGQTPQPSITRPPANGQIEANPIGTTAYQNPINIDGDLNDWATLLRASRISWTVFESIVYDPNGTCANQYPGTTRQNRVDLRGQVAFAYDEDNLYVAFLVDDDGYVSYNGNDERFFLGDAPQLLLDMDLAGDYEDDQVNQDDLQVDFHPGVRQPGLNARAALWQLETRTSRLFQAAQVSASSTNSGYFLEAALPWEALDFEPQPGATLGVAASISDNDTSGTNNQECMISTAPQRDWQNPATWGTLILGTSGQTQ